MGPLATHMALHILLMNLFAPLAAAGMWLLGRERKPATAPLLAFATVVQLAALWAWHAPPVLDRALASPSVHLLMYASLFLAALLFWWSVLHSPGERSWQPVVALLVTGKIYCFLAVLFVFAPRALYPGFAAIHAAHAITAPSTTLADQQLAGLIMLVACPATYVVAAVVLAARWLLAMEDAERHPESRAGAEAWT